MISEETRRSFGLEDTQLLKWRKGGRAQKAKTFLLVAGVVIMILLGIRMLAGAALPQNGGQRMRGPMTPEDQLARMTKQLQLTDDQQAKMKPILEEQHKQMMDLRQDTSMSREDRFAKFREVRQKSLETKMKAILTTEQQEKWQKIQEERRGRRGRPMPN
jgi:Spy/CpxP family protein refolding chaperone